MDYDKPKRKSTMQPIRDIDLINDIADYLKCRNERNYVMFMFGIYTGLRISDILTFRVRDVREEDYLYLREKKRDTEKYIEINPELKEILKEYIKDKDDWEYLFKSQKGTNQPLKRESAYAILREAADAFKLKCIGTHTMRKTYGYIIYQMYKDPVLLKEALGHSDVRTSLIYIGEIQDKVNDANRNISLRRKKRK